MTENIIYGLRDPRNDVYYYIGKSTVGVKRPLTHLFKSHSDAVNEWVDELKEHKTCPQIDIIERVDDINNLPERERHWIQYYKDINESLLNVMLASEKPITYSHEEDEKLKELYDLSTEFHTVIKNARLARGLTQDFVSSRCGISRSTLSLAERGINVTVETFKKVLMILIDYPVVDMRRSERATSTIE